MQARRKEHRAEFEREALAHLDALYGAAYRLARNPRDAEDLVQDALLRAYRFWDTFEKDSNCKAWLLRILTNTFINEYQRKKRSREVLDAAQAEQEATDGVLHHAAAETQKSPEGLLLERSVSDDVQRALDALPDEFRTAVVLCDIEGLSYKEIAEIMECPVGTVMSRLFRGRRLLEGALKEFAVAAGYVRPEPATPDDKGSDKSNAIDLATYRAARKNGREGT